MLRHPSGVNTMSKTALLQEDDRRLHHVRHGEREG